MELNKSSIEQRNSPLDMSAEEFRTVGHDLVDKVADFLATLRQRPVTHGESPEKIRELLGNASLPEKGMSAQVLLDEVAPLLFDHSLFNGHPRFWAYITSSAAPIGMLGDFLAAAVNPNCSMFGLSPIATEIESQTIRWIAEMIGYPTTGDGILVSGGNMANFVCFLAARKAKTAGTATNDDKVLLCVYASTETHTWLHKAVDLFGSGNVVVRWIPTNNRLQIDVRLLREKIEEDMRIGHKPFLVIGTAGSVSTGAIDPLADLAAICRELKLWFHVDGAYGGFAAVLPDAHRDLRSLAEADSVAVDPHKWLYGPLEAGCVLVRDPKSLTDAFSYHPPYYGFKGEKGEPPRNYHERGLQNSRGFRALKIWLALRQVGREGYVRMISDDIRLAQELFHRVEANAELEPFTHDLSIVTFRYVPANLSIEGADREEYLNNVNTELLTRLQAGGAAYLSNALLDKRFVLRACIVNFRTTLSDIDQLPGLVVQLGREIHAEMKSRQEKRTTQAT